MATSDSAYVRALTRAYTQNIKGNFLKIAKNNAVNSIKDGYAKFRNVYSKVDEDTAGNIYSAFTSLPVKLQKDLEDVRYDYMQAIFNMSQRLVPIDKKYIDVTSVSDIAELKSPRSYLIPKKPWKNTKTASITGISPEESGKQLSNYGVLNLSKGYYSGLVKDFFLTSNKRKRNQLYVDDDGNIISNYEGFKNKRQNYGNINNIKPLDLSKTHITTKEITGGNKELKKGGNIDVKRGIINYSSIAGGADWEYAQVQHDNLGYTHAEGKQALYLYDSLEHYKKQYRSALKEKALETFKSQFEKVKTRKTPQRFIYGKRKI